MNVSPWLGNHFEPLKCESHFTHDWVIQSLATGAAVPDVVRASAETELLAAGSKLTDEVVEVLVMRVSASLTAQDGNGYVGEGVPAWIELIGAFIQKCKPMFGGCPGMSYSSL